MEDKNAREEREQLLALNQVLARQVMERSRLVAGRVTPPLSQPCRVNWLHPPLASYSPN